MKAWCKLKRPRNIYACVFYQSQVFKQAVTKQKSCHSKQHTTHQFETKVLWLQVHLHRKCKSVVSCLTLKLRSLVVSYFGNLAFPVRAWPLAMCSGIFSAVIARLISKCLWNMWKWQRGAEEIASSFQYCPVICQCLWKKI